MIKPSRFDFNAQTAVNNRFQVRGDDAAVATKAAKEFDTFVGVLRQNGIDVTVVTDTPEPHTPDSVFPNNWISFHENGTVMLYPMFAENRRMERKQEVLDAIQQKFNVTAIIDLSGYEKQGSFLEGTGSMVLDRSNQIAYACLSPRTDTKLVAVFCEKTGYRAVTFTAVDADSLPIYHTNVMMCVADAYVVICLECIKDTDERKRVTDAIIQTGKQVVEISFGQVNHFTGNMLQVHNDKGEKLLVMSSQAFKSLNEMQLHTLQSFNRVIHSDITTIESNGGGSARCMMAEVFLSLKQPAI